MAKQNHKTKQKYIKGGKTDIQFYVQVGIIALLALVIIFNLGKIYSNPNIPVGFRTVSALKIIPSGVPGIYGEELRISYDDVSPSNPRLADSTIARLRRYENLELNSEEIARYIKIGSSISCEYCCGAKAIIFSNGKRACGCAHSYAMRGLTKYLLRYHPEVSNEEILSELGKWKVLFFPEIHEEKAKILEAKGINSTNYINLASNLYRGVEKGRTTGGMVGGC